MNTGRWVPTAVDAFSGCGGLSAGLKAAGFRVLLAIDNDPLAIETYRLNHRRTRLRCEDLRTVCGEEVLADLGLARGDLDLLAGCPPCQGFSSLRTLNGAKAVDDPRNDLIGEFARLAVEMRPKAILMENVPGLARDPRLNRLLRKLRRNGYSVDWDLLDAADYGVPQRRRRLIVFAATDGRIPFPDPLPVRRTVREAIGSLPSPIRSSDAAHTHSEHRTDRVRVLISMIPRNGGGRADLGEARQLRCHKHADGFNDIYGRMEWTKVAPTITSGFVNPSKGRFLHPTANRTITVREGALLQSFPATYKFPMRRGKYPAAEMIGNAVPPLFAAAQAACIRKFLERAHDD